MDKADYKELRLTVGSQEAAAGILGISRATLAKRESKKNKVPVTTEAAIAMVVIAKGLEFVDNLTNYVDAPDYDPKTGGINYSVPVQAGQNEEGEASMTVEEAFKVLGLDIETAGKAEVKSAGKTAQHKITVKPGYDELELKKANDAYLVALNHVAPIQEDD